MFKSKKGAIETIAAVVALSIGLIVVAVAVSVSQNVTNAASLGLTTQQRSLFSSSYTLLLVAVIAAIGAVAIGAFFYMKG